MGFKKGFLWGSATSAYQVEGAFDADGKGLSVQDVKEIAPGLPDLKVCADHYNRYKEDVALFAELGLKTYRFSIAWTRILPKGRGEVNQKGIEFYNNLINECLKYGITPIVTMYHFDPPLALEKEGGWTNPKTIDAFLEFARAIFAAYGDRVKYWLTINEQNMMILHPDAIGTTNPGKLLYQSNHYMLLAQAKTVLICREMLPEAKIGPAPNISYCYPATNKPEDALAAQYANAHRNWLYLDMAVYGEYNKMALEIIRSQGFTLEYDEADIELMKKAKPDFIAFNYYQTTTVAAYDASRKDLKKGLSEPGFYSRVRNENLPLTEWSWEVDAPGFRVTLNELDSRYHLPLLITENGLGDYDVVEADGSINDLRRINYLKDHISAMKEAVNTGVDVFGYCTWSVMDLISTHEGYLKRYGFIYINRDNDNIKDLARYKKRSFNWYRQVIDSNGEDLEIK